MAFIKFGSPEYFQRLDQQVNALLAPQLASGIMKQDQANQYRAEAQRKAHKAVSKFYGNSKYDGSGRLVRDSAPNTAEPQRVAMPFAVITNHREQSELERKRRQRNAGKARRQRMKKAA